MLANIAKVDEFSGAVAVLPCDAVTAHYYGEIKETLRSQGKPIPENDVWIAAVAQQFGLVLATRDDHFRAVGGLTVENW